MRLHILLHAFSINLRDFGFAEFLGLQRLPRVGHCGYDVVFFNPINEPFLF